MIVLDDKQRHAVNSFQELRVGALFMEPGTGKTAAMVEICKGFTDAMVVWLCPVQLIAQTKTEINSNWPNNSVLVAGIESLSSSSRIYLWLRDLCNTLNVCLVVDESLKVKNIEAIRTRRIIELGRLCQYRFILNGTPATKNVLDLWAQFEFLSPRILKMGYQEFKRNYCEIAEYRIKGSYPRRFEVIRKHHNLDHLFSLIRPYIVCASLDLSLNESDVYHGYDLSEDEEVKYNQIKERLIALEDPSSSLNFLVLVQKLQMSYSLAEMKVQQCKAIVAKGNAVVFVKYLATKDYLLKEMPGTKVLTFGKHSFGLNLQEFNQVVFFDKTWDYAQVLQVKRRVFRKGQKQDCTYHHFSMGIGLDDLIDKNISRKEGVLNALKCMSKTEIIEAL